MRSSLLVLLFLWTGLVSAYQVIAETTGKTTAVYLLIPYSDYGLDRPDSLRSARLDIYLAVMDRHGDIVFEEHRKDTRLRPPSRMAQGLTFADFFTRLSPGQYHLYIRVLRISDGLVSTHEQQLTVAKKTRRAGLLYQLWRLQDGEIVMNTPPDSLFPGDRCRIQQVFGKAPDSLVFSQAGHRIVMPPVEKLSYEFTPLAGKDPWVSTSARFGTRVVRTKSRPLTAGYLFQREYSTADQCKMLRFVLTSTDIDYLKNTREDSLQAAIDGLWQSLDPTPGTVVNELQDRFYRRVHEADSLFGTPGVFSGWDTDRGKVYVKYGPPWDVSGDAFPIGRPPYLIWTYPNLGKTFVFTDRKGYGNYELEQTID